MAIAAIEGDENKWSFIYTLSTKSVELLSFSKNPFNEGDKPQKWFEICDCYDKIKRIDVDYAGAFCKYINWYIDVLVNGCRFMLSFINYIRHTLDIEFEDSVRYKIIQRILKDNKSGGYSEEKKEITFTC